MASPVPAPVQLQVRNQYRRYPYPPIPALALPRRDPARALAFELGTKLAYGASHSHAGIRILIAGAGTLEPLVVALAHPLAREIVAVDLSDASLRMLETRLRVHRLTGLVRPRDWFAPRLPPIRLRCADLTEWEPSEPFDYIIASNVVHHVADPARLLARFASWMTGMTGMKGIGSVLRLVTYPKASRIWMREASAWLRDQGLDAGTPGLRKKTIEAINRLPSGHPVRSCFESHPEIGTETGIVDAFFHACENPLAPLEWRDAAARCGLRLAGETQDEGSRSDFLVALAPETASLDPWTRLQILDDLLELCANPVLWLAPGRTETAPDAPVSVSSSVRAELGANLRRARALLSDVGVPLEKLVEALRRKTGPRVNRSGKPLPGLSILDHDIQTLLAPD